MRKFILSICAFCAVLPFLSSCSLDKERQFTFQYEVDASLADEETWTVLEDYLKESYVGKKTYPILATYAEAYEQGVQYFDQDLKGINEDLILDCITDPTDIIYLYGVITGDKVRERIKYVFWNYDYKQQKRPDPDPDE